MGTLEARRDYAVRRFEELREKLQSTHELCEGKACVYATGSFGRLEASEHSDIDLFIVSLTDADALHSRGRLTKLDEILVKAELIQACRELSFPEFSKDGVYLQHHSSGMLIQTTGDRDDDATNTFTARLLLLLESRPLANLDVHRQIIDEVIAKYWREYPEHTQNFMPAFLANDVLRFWRTLCLNYEASTHEKTPRDRAKRKLKNYKLKHSRMLTCYSALLFLLHIYRTAKTVTVQDAREMVSITPTERIAFLQQRVSQPVIQELLNQVLKRYERFLQVTSVSEDELLALFGDDDEAHKLRAEQSEFGDVVFQLLLHIGDNSALYRRLVV